MTRFKKEHFYMLSILIGLLLVINLISSDPIDSNIPSNEISGFGIFDTVANWLGIVDSCSADNCSGCTSRNTCDNLWPSCEWAGQCIESQGTPPPEQPQLPPPPPDQSDQPPRDTTPPIVSVSQSPLSATSDQTVQITVTASDPSGILAISILVDNVLVETCTTSPCSTSNTYSVGSHSYLVNVQDTPGNRGTASGTMIIRAPPESSTLLIQHTPVSTGTTGSNIDVSSTVTSNYPVSNVYLRYLTTGSTFESVLMTKTGNTYIGSIPALNSPGTIRYYISASDGKKSISYPASELNAYSIVITTATPTPPVDPPVDSGGTSTNEGDDSDTTAPQDNINPEVSVSHSPASPTTNNPVTFTATATDDSGITEVNIFVDGVKAKSCPSSPCTLVSTYTSAGAHTYFAEAWDQYKANKGRFPSSGTNSFSVTEVTDPYQPSPPPTKPVINSVTETSERFVLISWRGPGNGITGNVARITGNAVSDKGFFSKIGDFFKKLFGIGATGTNLDSGYRYIIERRLIDSGVVSQIGTVRSSDSLIDGVGCNNNGCSYLDESVINGKGYSYVITVIRNSDGQNSASDASAITISSAPIIPPTDDSSGTGTTEEGNEDTTPPGDTTPPVDNINPEVSVSHSPASPTTNNPVTFTATATDDSGITEVNIFVDGVKAKSCPSSPCTLVSTYTSAGAHTYFAEAWDQYKANKGRFPSSGTNSFSVTGVETPPSDLIIQHNHVTSGVAGQGIEIVATVTTVNTIPYGGVTISYRDVGTYSKKSLKMSETSTNTYTATIPAQDSSSSIEYWINARDGINAVSYPSGNDGLVFDVR